MSQRVSSTLRICILIALTTRMFSWPTLVFLRPFGSARISELLISTFERLTREELMHGNGIHCHASSKERGD